MQFYQITRFDNIISQNNVFNFFYMTLIVVIWLIPDYSAINVDYQAFVQYSKIPNDSQSHDHRERKYEFLMVLELLSMPNNISGCFRETQFYRPRKAQ